MKSHNHKEEDMVNINSILRDYERDYIWSKTYRFIDPLKGEIAKLEDRVVKFTGIVSQSNGASVASMLLKYTKSNLDEMKMLLNSILNVLIQNPESGVVTVEFMKLIMELDKYLIPDNNGT